MPHDQPQFIQPLRLAETKECLSGRFLLVQMERLKTYLSDDNGHVDYKLQFGIDESGLRYIESEIDAVVHVRCERCLKSFQLEISHQSMLGIVSNRQALERLASNYEPLLIEKDDVNLLDLLEDDILLSMPIAPLHDVKVCSASKTLEAINENDTTHPFAKLKVLKQKQ